MADLSHLGNLNPTEPLDLENYADNKESVFRLPAKGRYTLQAPDTFPAAAFQRTKANNLSIQIDPTIVGPTNEGFQLRFTNISAKPFARDGKTVSQVGDYLRACGFKGTLRNEQEIADAIEITAGTVYEAKLDWRAYSKSGFQLQGMERFPKLPDGSYQSWVPDPTLKNEDGSALRVRAKLIIDRFIPAGE
jgi:hypothetical protein